MSVAVAPSVPALPAAASVVVDGAGVRFDFDRRSRVVPPALARIRRVRTTAWGLRGIDLRLEPGAGLALVGPTGSGKTTLLRVLAGVMQPDEGRVEVRGRVGTMLATGFGLQVLLTGRENSLLLVYLFGWPATRKRFLDVRCAAVYWYFVVLSWLPFYFFIYVQPWLSRKGM